MKKGFTEELGNLQKTYEETIGTPVDERGPTQSGRYDTKYDKRLK